MNNYWHPQFKWQLVEWLTTYAGMERWKLEKMCKKRLYAIYYKERGNE